MRQQSTLALKVGLVLITGLILLIGFSLRSGGKGWFYKGYPLWAEFRTAKGIEPGSKVVLAGVPIGQVEALEALPREGKVRARLLIDAPHEIPSDSVGSIRLKTLLGNYQVYIEPGRAAASLAAGAALRTEEVQDITESLQALGQVGKGSGDLIGSLQRNQERLFAQLDQILTENRDNLRQTTAAFAQGAPKFQELMQTLSELSHQLQDGKGALGRLATDERLAGQLQRIADNMERFSNDLNSGQGTLSRLAHDEMLGQRVEETIHNVNAASGRLRALVERNEAPLERAVQAAGTALPKIGEGMDEFARIGRKINSGEGTLGKLVNDPELYNTLRDAAAQVRRTFEEGEEQGVMRTFLAVFFGSVI